MALLPPLRECLGGLVTSGLWMEEITTVGRDGQRFDLGRAEQLMDHGYFGPVSASATEPI